MANKLVITQINRRSKKAQVTLELASSFICILLLLWGSLQLLLWVNKRFVVRQVEYEATRVDAGSSSSEIQVNESDSIKFPPFNIFSNYR